MLAPLLAPLLAMKVLMKVLMKVAFAEDALGEELLAGVGVEVAAGVELALVLRMIGLLL